MNDLINFAKHWPAEDDLSPHDVGFKLNDIFLSALATTKAQGYGKPMKHLRRCSDHIQLSTEPNNEASP